jgi:two-component system, NtrC family, sensor kinase
MSMIHFSFSRISLRTRLVLAFCLLIISSASATIVIGNTVFGNRVDGFARENVVLCARIAAQALASEVAALRLSAVEIAANADGIAHGFPLGGPADFILIARRSGAPEFWQARLPGKFRSLELGIDPGFAAALQNRFASLTDPVQKTQKAVSGIVRISGDESGNPGSLGATAGSLWIAAAAPLGWDPGKTPGYALVGASLAGRTGILEQARLSLPEDWRKGLVLSISAADGRVVAADGELGAHGNADAGVMETVLRRGEPFVGITGTGSETQYSAFLPIRDLSGTAVGMIGTGNGRDAVAAVRKKTTLLFTSLIAAGMIFGFAMTFLFSAWLVNPIRQLAEGVTRVADGDLDHKVRVASADDLGTLTRAFNQMVQAIRERDHKLREMTESRLSQAEKQISIGRLAAGVAHEINNPLTAILTLTRLGLKKMRPEDPIREDLEIVVTEAARCRDIVKNLLDFARERPVEMKPVDIKEVLRDTIVLAKKSASVENVQLESALAGIPLNVNADAKLLQQVFINLILNGAEAAEPDGSVRIVADEDSSGGFVQVKVEDNGKGIAPEHLGRVFEPFFTTKGAGKGTGLGLSVSLGIIQKHGGSIEIASVEGKGTTVTVLLPRLKEVEA